MLLFLMMNGSRRWLRVSLQLRIGQGLRREFFLLNPKSVMIRESADGLVIKRMKVLTNNLIIEIEGVDVELDFNGGDDRTRNINLLETVFLNIVD